MIHDKVDDFKSGKVNISKDVEQQMMMVMEIWGLEGGGVTNT